MNYSLGNMLNGGESLNADGLSLNLQFATDKTLTARKGPTPTFTRASNATYYGPLVDFGGQTYPATGIVNGRAEWKIVDGSDYKSFEYTGGVWRYTEFFSGEGITFDSAATSAFRPEQANWSASGLTASPTTSSTFGIVRAAINEPRFDHATTAPNACRGLLIEESRTNLQPYSSDYTQTATSWSSTIGMNAAVLASTVSPDGTQNGVRVSENTATSLHRTSSASITGTAQPYTVSIFVKAGSSPRRYISFGFVYQNIRVIWDTQTSSFTGVTPGTTAPTSYSSQDFGNGWYRLIVTATPAAGGIGLGVLFYNGAESYAGDGTSNVFLWGAQLEAGSFPTSYIPTTTASVVRSADLCSITGSAFTGMYNTPEGTLFAGVTPQPTAQLAAVVLVNSSSFNNLQSISKAESSGSSQGLKWVLSQNPPLVTPTTSLDEANVFSKISMGYKSGDSALYYNNKFGTSTSSVFTSINPTQMQIGSRDGQRFINGHISEVKYFKKRLSNAKLQAITV